MRLHRLSRQWIAAIAVLFLFTAPGAARAQDPNPPSIKSTRGAWPLYRQWNTAEVGHFAKWIENIYLVKANGTLAQRLAKIEGVLTDPQINLLLDPAFSGETVNPQLGLPIIRAMNSVIDCGKLTVALSAYYAYRRGLPWMVNHVRASDGSDLRTAPRTIPVGAMNAFNYTDTYAFFTDAVTGLCTGNFRVEPFCDSKVLSDTAPVAIDRRYLIPGCLFYLDGHVLIVAHITKYGEPMFLDATTAASRDIYTHNGFNAVTGIPPRQADQYAGCYRGFLVHRFPVAETDAEGNVLNVRRRTNEEMAEFGFSTEQYEKIQELIDTQAILEQGHALDSFHKFVGLRLRTATTITPGEDLHAAAAKILDLLRQREQMVQNAWQDVQQNGPIVYPEHRGMENIFNAGGRWGSQSTALFDVGLRCAYFNLIDSLNVAVQWFDLMPEAFNLDPINKHAVWTQSDLAAALLHEKRRVFASSLFNYTNSKGQQITLSLLDIEKRLYDLSFDPNHPPELRWGAAPGTTEAATAPETVTPVPGGTVVPMTEAYRRQAYYRTLSQREVEESYLREMLVEGYPVRQKLDEVAQRWPRRPSPPLVPHSGKAAWLAEQKKEETAG
jgi:hypothetical protein